MHFVLIVCQVKDYQKWLKLSCRPFAFNSYKAFLEKTERGVKLVSLPHFCMIFEGKCFCWLKCQDKNLKAIFKKGNGEWGLPFSTKFCRVNNLRLLNSLKTIIFCDSWYLSMFAPIIFLGHSFGWRTANASILMKFRNLHKSRAVTSMVTIDACQCWHLSSVGHGFGRRTANALIVMKFSTMHKVRVVNSIVTIAFCDSRRFSKLTPVNIGTCHLLGNS